MASTANVEQLGKNRQERGRAGAIRTWYARSAANSVAATKPVRTGLASGGEFQRARELGGRLGIGEGVRPGLRYDEKIGRRPQLSAMLTKQLSKQALESIPDDGVAHPTADRDPQS
jgi:hypothetical protein